MYKLFMAFIMTLSVLVGCNANTENVSSDNNSLSFMEVSKEDLNKEVLEFINDVQEKNGVNLYYVGQNVIYVYLNGSQVEQGEKAVHYSNFNVEEDGNTLNIFYVEAETSDYSNQSLNFNLLYKIDLNKKYETIRGFSNGEEASFNVVSGNGL